jgi:hypothetical protein
MNGSKVDCRAWHMCYLLSARIFIPRYLSLVWFSQNSLLFHRPISCLMQPTRTKCRREAFARLHNPTLHASHGRFQYGIWATGKRSRWRYDGHSRLQFTVIHSSEGKWPAGSLTGGNVFAGLVWVTPAKTLQDCTRKDRRVVKPLLSVVLRSANDDPRYLEMFGWKNTGSMILWLPIRRLTDPSLQTQLSILWFDCCK